MSECVHEWRIIRKWTGDTLVKCDLCDESMGVMEINRRLNEYDKLKGATETLMVGIKDTHFLQGKNECLRKSVGKDCQICEAYADILEGK